MHLSNPEPDRQLALQAAGTGTFTFNTFSGTIHIDEHAGVMLGLKTEEVLPYSRFLKALHHDYREIIDASLEASFASQTGTLNIKFPIAAPSGKTIWIRLKGSRTADGQYSGIVLDVTEDTKFEKNLADSGARFRSMIEEASVAIALYVGASLEIAIANDIMLSYWGKDRSVIGTRLEDAVPELEGQPFVQILTDIFTTGETYEVTEAPAELALEGVLGVYYFDFTYKPLYDSNGTVYAILNTAVNVTDRVQSKRRLEASESNFRALTEQSPMAVGLLKGRDMVIEIGNEKIFEVWGKDSSVTGKRLIDALPEIKDQQFIGLLEKVYDTGQPYFGYDVLAKLEHNGKLTDKYFDFTYSALKDENGNTLGVLVIANDVTQRVISINKIAENEAKFRALMQAAPAAMVMFMGAEELIIDMPNQALLDIIGKDESINGMPLLEVVPEIEGQESLRLIKETFSTGQKNSSYGRQVKLMKNGVLTENYYNISYTPLFDTEGNVYAVLDTAIDVTESIKAQKAIQEAEAALRSAIELAQLGTWQMDPKTGNVSYSERLKEWFGFEKEVENIDDVVSIIHPDDRAGVVKAIEASMLPGSTGMYDAEYRVINRITGRERVLHAQGKAFFDETGVYLMAGTAQDITTQRKIQTALENEVKVRTEELREANKELEEANRMLLASNGELAQYAYVASHDLQEPLRKIRMFSNLLSEKDSDNRHKAIIDKILSSSERMSLLIKDLLEFSRLLNTDSRFTETNINDIVSAVIDDFELLIEEKHATVTVTGLPVIDAVPLQMNQLFYNLLNNALKFTVPGRNPVINLDYKLLEKVEAEKYLPHTDSDSRYCKISVRDNGIGIEEQYTKQIFEVFKRLHGRDEYSGSGIGLAICRRIVANHNGAIYINSEVGKGTTFNIILPEKQTNLIHANEAVF